jgi:ABC-type dipeptide/oligopeptide/nickel transport system permease subunit
MFRELLKIVKRDFTMLFSLAVIFTLVIFSIFPQYIARYDYRDNYLQKRFTPPCLDYPLGTDFLGRDILSLIIWGSRLALVAMIWPTVVSATIGVALGIIAGYIGGMPDHILMRVVDVLMGFPSFLLSLAILNTLGPGLTNAMWAVTIGRIPEYVRLSRSLSLPMKEIGYVEYAKALGASKIRIITRYILPNILAPIIVQMTFSMPGTLITIASLSFLGLGGRPPTSDWGVLLQQSRKYLRYAPWAALIPGFAIFFISFAFNSIGEAMRDIVDPRKKYVRIF